MRSHQTEPDDGAPAGERVAAVVDHTVVPDYFHHDQQGVVFHMWFVAYLEQARNEYLRVRGYPLGELLADGCDIQVVHLDLDWSAPCRYGDVLVVRASMVRAGTTSLVLAFDVTVAGESIATARGVYVIVDRESHAKTSLPVGLRRAIGTAAVAAATQRSSTVG